MAFGFLGSLVVAILLVGGLVFAVVRGTRSSRAGGDSGSGERGGIGMGVGVLLLVLAGLAVTGVLTLLLGATSRLVKFPIPRPEPGEVSLHVQGMSMNVDRFLQAFDAALERAVDPTCSPSEASRSSSVTGRFGSAIAIEARRLNFQPREGMTALPPEPLDFEALRLEYEFAVSGLVDDVSRADDLAIVIGYHHADGSVQFAAALEWVDGEPRFVSVEPDEVFSDFGFAGPADFDVEIVPEASDEPITPVPPMELAPDPVDPDHFEPDAGVSTHDAPKSPR
jgi:hypothetical protein